MTVSSPGTSRPEARDKASDEDLMCCVRDTGDLDAYGCL